jgi:hypothetical protein
MYVHLKIDIFFYINSNEIFKLIFSYKKSLIDQLLRKKKEY